MACHDTIWKMHDTAALLSELLFDRDFSLLALTIGTLL